MLAHDGPLTDSLTVKKRSICQQDSSPSANTHCRFTAMRAGHVCSSPRYPVLRCDVLSVSIVPGRDRGTGSAAGPGAAGGEVQGLRRCRCGAQRLLLCYWAFPPEGAQTFQLWVSCPFSLSFSLSLPSLALSSLCGVGCEVFQ